MMQARPHDSSSLYEVVIIAAIFSGWYIYASIGAVLDGFPAREISNTETIEIVIFECVAFAVAAMVLLARGWRVADFKFSVTLEGAFIGLLLAAIAIAIHLTIWTALTSIGYGRGELWIDFSGSVAFPVAILFAVTNGAFEEFFLSRYLLDALGRFGAVFAVGVSALIRLLYHIYQGPLGALSVLGFGLVLTVYYVRSRNLWPVMFAHILTDFAALL